MIYIRQGKIYSEDRPYVMPFSPYLPVCVSAGRV